MKRLIITLVILSLFLVGCSTEVVEEQTVEEQIDEVQSVVEEVMDVTESKDSESSDKPAETDTIKEVIEEPVEEVIGTTHLVQIKNDGFDPDTITIKTGDTVQWENVRSGNLKKALIVGSSPCTNVKSATLMPEETFSWTFEEPAKCSFSDAIAITYVMKVTVEE